MKTTTRSRPSHDGLGPCGHCGAVAGDSCLSAARRLCPPHAARTRCDDSTPALPGRSTPDGISRAVRVGGLIQLGTLKRLLALLAEKTDYPHHISVEVTVGAVLKMIDNESDAQETIRRLLEVSR